MNDSGIIDIEGTYGGAYIHWSEDNPPILEWNEGLRFHHATFVEEDNYPIKFNFPSVGDLTKVKDRLLDLLPGKYSVYVSISDWDFDEIGDQGVSYPYLLISVWSDNIEDHEWKSMSDEEIFNEYWDAAATLLNVTDPGTFNSPYLFSEGF